MTSIESKSFDLIVVGGGLAGVCAAIAAARLGVNVALVQNRPVLGGNSSSEVRVWVCGATATGHQRFARETGIVGELYLNNEFVNPLGNPYYWDLVLLDAVRAEANITLYLNTECLEVTMESDQIYSITSHVIGSERRITMSAKQFIDCSGDGVIAAQAGAAFLLGRESQSTYDEDWAPEVADETTLGSTLLFYTRTEAEPVPFVAPSFAIDITQTSIPTSRILRTGDNGADYWWIEWGGELDVVKDNERIRDELWSVIYGIWDYIKNSGNFEADKLTLEWVGSVPGKREYRRVVGDYMMTQRDILNDVTKEDAVGFGGWSIDLHPAKGVYEPRGAAQQLYPDGVYDIPFRSLYSKTVKNLLVAGRNASASHVAFGSLRVMATCGVMGEAAGTAAALCFSKGISPRELSAEYSKELQQLLIKQDASLLGVRGEDPLDIATEATITSSSSLRLDDLTTPTELLALDRDTGVLFPVDKKVDAIEVYVSATAQTPLIYTLYNTAGPRSYVPGNVLESGALPLESGQTGWVTLPIRFKRSDLANSANAVLVLHRNCDVSVGISDEYVFGLLGMARQESLTGQEIDDHVVSDSPNDVVRWGIKPFNRRRPAIRVHGDSSPFGANETTSGLARPFGGPQMWSSQKMEFGQPEWVQLEWERPRNVEEIRVVFNDDVNNYVNNLHYTQAPFRIVPELVADYRIQVLGESGWTSVYQIEGNRRRHRVHALRGQQVRGIRICVDETNGSPFAQIVVIRAYSEAGTGGSDA